MRSDVFTRCVVALFVAALVLAPDVVLGCSVCFGKSDSAMARGMNMGIFSLLGVITAVLSGVAGFFIFLARRSARMGASLDQVECEEPITRS